MRVNTGVAELILDLLISHGANATPRNTSENITRFESVPKDGLGRAVGFAES